MKRLRKTIAVMGMAAVMVISSAVSAFAGTWQNIGGYWYFSDPEDTGSDDHLVGWQWIDGYCYYLDPEAGGAMAVLTITPDGFMVDAEGHWINEFGIPYYLEGLGYSTSSGPISAGMDYTDPALSGPAFADMPEEVRYPGDDVIISGSSQISSSPSYGALYGGISVQTLLEIRNAIREAQAAEKGVEEAEERIETVIESSGSTGGNSGKSEVKSEASGEKSEAAEEKSEVTAEKSGETEEKSSGSEDTEGSKEKTEEVKDTQESKESTEKTEEKSTETEKESSSDKETKSEGKDSNNKDSQSKEDSEDN